MLLNKYNEPIIPWNIDGDDCVTIKQAASLIDRSESSIRALVIHGNTDRRLRSIMAGDKPFIPISELLRFPFIQRGRRNASGYCIVNYKIKDNRLVPVETFKNTEEGANE